jgi:hypothetical protein
MRGMTSIRYFKRLIDGKNLLIFLREEYGFLDELKALKILDIEITANKE